MQKNRLINIKEEIPNLLAKSTQRSGSDISRYTEPVKIGMYSFWYAYSIAPSGLKIKPMVTTKPCMASNRAKRVT
jgi:hypothetical protein